MLTRPSHGEDASDEVAVIEASIAELTKSIHGSPRDAPAHLARGVLYGQIGAAQQAIEDFSASIEIDSSNAEAYYNRGLARVTLKQHLLAIDDFTAALRVDPSQVDSLNNRAAAFFELGHAGEALRDAEDVIRLQETHPGGHAIRALGLTMMSDDEGAEASARRAEALGFNGRTLQMLMRREREQREA